MAIDQPEECTSPPPTWEKSRQTGSFILPLTIPMPRYRRPPSWERKPLCRQWTFPRREDSPSYRIHKVQSLELSSLIIHLRSDRAKPSMTRFRQEPNVYREATFKQTFAGVAGLDFGV